LTKRTFLFESSITLPKIEVKTAGLIRITQFFDPRQQHLFLCLFWTDKMVALRSISTYSSIKVRHYEHLAIDPAFPSYLFFTSGLQ
jgi:hypothetical protein